MGTNYVPKSARQITVCKSTLEDTGAGFLLTRTSNSQGGKGTKVDVYLPYRGAISFYVYIVPSGLISIFQDVVCDKISCGLQPTRFFLNFL